jgi:hypothetical protein
MEFNSRDEIWSVTWKAYYDTYFQEILSERVVMRWQRFDEFTKVLIALTASGSAFSGWALWNQVQFKIIWAIIAGTGAILAIFHKSLEVSNKISSWVSSRSKFCLLRFDYEILLNKMRFDPEFSVNECKKDLDDLLKRFADCYQKIKVDAFLTGRLKNSAQDELDILIKNKQ